MNTRINKKIIFIVLLIFAVILFASPKILAAQEAQQTDGGTSLAQDHYSAPASPKFSSEDINPESYKTELTYDEGEYLFKKAGRVLSLLRAISVMVAVISISILGIKYMVGSLEEKAQYKEKMLPIAIGAILIGSISSILIAISNIMNS